MQTRPIEPGTRLIVATHNEGKLRELRALLQPFGVDLVSAGALGLAEPEETAPDFAGNATLKALTAARAGSLPALADDSGFCVAALGGAPGVLSARWAGPGRDFRVAMQRVRDEAGDALDRRAWFVCALALAWPDGTTATYLGRAEGALVWPPRGEHGFGYDPIFAPTGSATTYGEMQTAEKEQDSHRSRAIRQLVAAHFGR